MRGTHGGTMGRKSRWLGGGTAGEGGYSRVSFVGEPGWRGEVSGCEMEHPR